MSSVKVSPNLFADAIAQALLDYDQDVTDGLKKDVKAAAKEVVADVKSSSPKRTGKYAKGWGVKTAYESNDDICVVVHNKTNWQLTHLLENGHACKNGTGRKYPNVKAYPHIKQAEEKAIEKLGNKVKVRIEG